MNGDTLSGDLQNLLARLRRLRKTVDEETTTNVSRAGLRQEAQAISTHWRENLRPRIRSHGNTDADTVKEYDAKFKKLLELSISPNRRTSYVATVASLCHSYRKDLILPAVGSTETPTPTAWDSFLSALPPSAEGEYFREAVDCAKAGFIRAAAVMGWCACVDHLHRKIAAIGFSTFSLTSEKLAAQTSGRFKRFNKKFAVDSMADLRATVFDDDLLIIIEGMGLMDNNQYRRLRSCLDLRNQAAHPGDAPITEYNLMSFFSDLVGIVLSNPTFGITTPGEQGA